MGNSMCGLDDCTKKPPTEEEVKAATVIQSYVRAKKTLDQFQEKRAEAIQGVFCKQFSFFLSLI